MELRQVRYFVAVAESLSFRQAGNHLHISQPSLSVQIKQLEDELGVSLLRRSKRRVEITRAGEVFLSAAREVLVKVKQASAAALHAERGNVDPLIQRVLSLFKEIRRDLGDLPHFRCKAVTENLTSSIR
jgi:DNA-binding transcriptional LysR family regulator